VKPEKRQQEVVSLLRALQRELTVEEIATHFGTSTLTVRRDLDSLVKRYWSRELQVEPQAFFNELKQVNVRIYAEN